MTLFLFAYNRIWKSRALRGWEMFFLIVLVIWLAALLHGYQSIILSMLLYFISLVCLILLTPILLAAWVNAAHVTTGLYDDTLRIVPLSPYSVLYPKLLAVILTWLQFFIPFLIFLSSMAGINILDPTLNKSIPGIIIFWSVIELVGLMLMWSAWGIMCGSRIAINGGIYLVLYFFPPVIFLIFLFAGFNLQGYFGSLLVGVFKTYRILPVWLEFLGILGYLLGFIYMLLAGKIWGMRG